MMITATLRTASTPSDAEIWSTSCEYLVGARPELHEVLTYSAVVQTRLCLLASKIRSHVLRPVACAERPEIANTGVVDLVGVGIRQPVGRGDLPVSPRCRWDYAGSLETLTNLMLFESFMRYARLLSPFRGISNELQDLPGTFLEGMDNLKVV